MPKILRPEGVHQPVFADEVAEVAGSAEAVVEPAGTDLPVLCPSHLPGQETIRDVLERQAGGI